jgi:dipeptidyl aminopeptidase/acylaminoacyl peptidase
MRRVVAVILFSVVSLFGQTGKQPFTPQALMRVARISEPQLSPDGKLVAFTVGRVDIEANLVRRQIFVVSSEGGAVRQLTTEGTQNSRPRWSPDSRQIAFQSNRGGASQIWVMEPDGSNQRQVTRLATEAEGHIWTPDGSKLIFLSRVYLGCQTDACNKEKLDADKASKVKARIYTSLLYRHWTEWQDQRRSQLMMTPLAGGAVRQLTAGTRDVPPFSLSGGDGYAVSPDGKELVFVMNTDENLAMSTNSDLFAIPLTVEGPVDPAAATVAEPLRITTNPAADTDPQYSPDGKYLAYRTQSRPGYESDKWRLVVLDRASGTLTSITDGVDRPVQSFTFTPDSSRIAYTTEDRGSQSAMMIPAGGGSPRSIISGAATVDELQFSKDNRFMVCTQQTGSSPVEIYRVSQAGGVPLALTRLNDTVIADYTLTPFEEFWVSGADGDKIHSFLLKPPKFDATKKYPVLFLIHGGPQGAWSESWSYRWNPQVFAAAGFVVVMPNPRGSTGYGQKLTDDINRDWGGKVYTDIMASVDHASSLPYVDKDRMAAAGGSYGGYMVDWILGHSKRFKALVSHAGVYDLRSMAGATEELWFPTWDLGGMPWQSPEDYERWSPSASARDFSTPTLVIHGELDFRVPYTQGLQLFTALQMQQVPSKLLVFPDEGHWVLKPQNSLLWHQTFLDWITQWTRKVEAQPEGAGPTAEAAKTPASKP